MIRSYKHRALREFFVNGTTRYLTPDLLKRVHRILRILDAAEYIEELNLPGLYLHELKGARKGTWSIRVTGNFRLTFRFKDGHAYDIDLEDYH